MSNQRVTQATVVAQPALNPLLGVEQFALFDPSGNPVTPTPGMVLTGYTIGSSSAALAATDTLIAALGKLETRVAALEA